MEKIDTRIIWSYFDEVERARPSSNHKIRQARGHSVSSYFQLAKKIAELQFLNRDHVLLFRGQRSDHLTTKGNSMLKASLFRLGSSRLPTQKILENRFEKLKQAEDQLVKRYTEERLQGFERLKRYRIIRWAILQHYEVCPTPLLDVTHSIRIAATFASRNNQTSEAYVFVLAGC